MTGKQTLVSKSPSETFHFGEVFAHRLLSEKLSESVVILLYGPMGSGKTELAKGIAQGLGVKQSILSPTYAIAREYPYDSALGKRIFLHADLWRMKSSQELLDVNFPILSSKLGVAVIEWADMFEAELRSMLSQMKVHVIHIHCQYGDSESERKLSIEST